MERETARRDLAPGELSKITGELTAGFDFTKPLSKRHRIVAALVAASLNGYRVTRFDVESIGDHVLNSTVHQIQKNDLIEVARADTTRPTRFGVDAHCKEYWLESKWLEYALAHLRGLSSKQVA